MRAADGSGHQPVPDREDVLHRMNDVLSRRAVLVSGLTAGAAGIAALWAGGVEFPVAIPPGLVILLIGVGLAGFVRRPWTAWLGAGLGLFVLVGFLLAGVNGDGFDYLLGDEGALVALGQAVEVLGVLVAAVSGPLVARRGDG